MKKIIVACGSGIATSQNVAYRVDQALKKAGAKNYEVDAVDIKNIAHEIKSADAYVSLVPESKNMGYKIPVFNGIKFLTNVGADDELKKILDILNE